VVTGDRAKFKQKIVDRINKRANKDVVEIKNDAITVKETGSKLFDVLGGPEEVSTISKGVGEEFLGLGLRFEKKTTTLEGVKTTTFSEQASAKLVGGLGVLRPEVTLTKTPTARLTGLFGPEKAGRLKDVGDFFLAETLGVELLKARGLGRKAKIAEKELFKFEAAFGEAIPKRRPVSEKSILFDPLVPNGKKKVGILEPSRGGPGPLLVKPSKAPSPLLPRPPKVPPSPSVFGPPSPKRVPPSPSRGVPPAPKKPSPSIFEPSPKKPSIPAPSIFDTSPLIPTPSPPSPIIPPSPPPIPIPPPSPLIPSPSRVVEPSPSIFEPSRVVKRVLPVGFFDEETKKKKKKKKVKRKKAPAIKKFKPSLLGIETRKIEKEPVEGKLFTGIGVRGLPESLFAKTKKAKKKKFTL
jgi:hypothetical protein